MTAHRLLTLIATLVIVSTALSMPSTAQVRIPPDFQFEGAKDSPGPVTFSHEKHRAKVEKCQACHVKVFKMKKGATGPLTMAKMKAGEQCGAACALLLGRTQRSGDDDAADVPARMRVALNAP